tara:strand:- start:510 stop:1172 length:663 start_codon:yes stop_codon:yes gene_type:complete
MDWETLIDERVQTTTWDMNKEVSKDIVDEIMSEVHKRSASKQNVVRYNIHIFDWSDTEFRNHFNEFCIRDPYKTPVEYNTQVLAPYLFIFTRRKEAYWNRAGDPNIVTDLETQIYNRHLSSSMETGIASANIILSAKAKGLDTGYCQCFDWNYKNIDAIIEKLEVEDIKDIYLSLGLGYGSSLKRTLNLHTNQWFNTFAHVGKMWEIESKPEKDNYIKFR